MNENIHLEIAKLIGEPISYKLPVPVEIAMVSDLFEVEPGEHLWRYTDVDTAKDTVLKVSAGGAITVVERSPIGDTEITLTGLHSKLEYVEVNDVLSSPDTNILGRRKRAITRSMDKRELKALLDGIINGTDLEGNSALPSSVTIPTVSVDTGDDLYDVIMEAKHAIEDYGDQYILLAGSTVKEKIDTYDKDNASTFNYNVTLSAKLRELGIDVAKIFGTVELTDGGGELALLNAKKFILLARNSRVEEGKPVKFARRRISADIAKLMGADVDKAQRALISVPTPVQASGNKLAYGVYGYESIAFCIPNPKAIAVADCTSII